MTTATGKAGKRLSAQSVDASKHPAASDAAHEGDVLDGPQDRPDRRKRDLPPGLSDRDADILCSVKRRATELDKRFSLCGARFGWTFIIAIVPGVGDAVCPVLGYFLVVHQARKAKIPWKLTQRMILNLVVSASIGLVPGIGDILLASFRANMRNAKLLENFLVMRGERAGKATQTQAATAQEKRDDESRGAERSAEDDSPAPPEMVLVPPSPSGEVSASDGDKEKEKCTTTASPDAGTILRPRNTLSLEGVLHRDSRFIEDVS